MILGLTGGIASGKSSVAGMFKELGIVVIDADQIAREVVEPNEEGYSKIVEVFGKEIIHKDGTINRERLGSIIFNNKVKREQLNNIIHPLIRQRMAERTKYYFQAGERTIVLDIPLLFESKLTYLVDKTIVVYVNDEVQLMRLMARNKFTSDEAKSRISSQMPLKEKVLLADYVLDNNGSLENTREQLLQLLKDLGIG